MKKRKGVSLIVLIITIVVIIILAATVILTLSKNNPIESAKEARFKEDVRTFQDELNMYISKEYQQTQGARDWKITATEYEKDSTKENYNNSVYKYLSSFKKKYENVIAIKEDQIAFVGDNEKEREWLLNSGIYMSKKFTIKYVDGYGNELLPQEEIKELDVEYTYYPKEVEGYMPLKNEITGIAASDTTVTFEYCKICYDLNFVGLNSNGVETTDEASIVSYAVAGMGDCTYPYVAIPEKYNNKEIVKIQNNAFKQNNVLQAIVVPESIKNIQSNAFLLCKTIKKVTLNANNLDTYAFSQCSNLEKVEIGMNVSNIKSFAFKDCPKLNEFKIYSENITFGDSVFFGGNLLNNITVNSKNNSYVVKDGVMYTKDMKKLVMYSTNRSGKYVVPDTVIQILPYAFGASNKIEEVEIPNNVEIIGIQAFKYCSNLNKAIINAKTIDSYGFVLCSNLKNVEIGKNVRNIKSFAFNSCTKLSEFKIYSEDISFGDSIFFGGTLLNNITVNEENKSYVVEDGVMYTKDMKTIVMYSPNRSGKYITPDTVIQILPYAFGASNKIEEVEILKNVENIGDSAFKYCSNLKTVKIDTNYIGYGQFLICQNLQNVEISENVTKISSDSFRVCQKLTEITYKSTKENWNKITFGQNWKYDSNKLKIVHCTDGDIEI